MKLSGRTVALLKSFTGINPSIYVAAGSALKTISVQKTIFASATVDEEFESEFAIYDLNQFLATLSLFKEAPELTIGEHSVKLKGNGSAIEYFFADKSMITAPPSKDLSLPDVTAEFVLTKEVFANSMKAASVLQLENWTVVGKDGKISIVVQDTKNSTSNKYDTEVGETDETFQFVFRTENLKLIPGDYQVKISSKGISQFSTNEDRVNYFIAVESTK